MNSSNAGFFVDDLGREISQLSGDVRPASFLFQHISISTQRFSSLHFLDSFISSERRRQLGLMTLLLVATLGFYKTDALCWRA